MSVNKEYKNIINKQTSYSFNNGNIVTVKDKIIYGMHFKDQTSENQFGRKTSFLSYSGKSGSSNNTKNLSLTSYFGVSEAMGLDSRSLNQIKNVTRRYLYPEEYEKIKQFFQKHLSPNSTNHLKPFDPSKLSDLFPEKLKIEKSLLQKITRGIDEIIKNETHINHPEKSGLNNKKAYIDLTNEENHYDQNSIVNHPPKKAKTAPIGLQPSASHQGAIPVYQTLFLEKAVQSTNEAMRTSSIQTAFRIDDLFYNIPEDELFLPEEPSLSSTNQAASSSPPLLLDDLLLPSFIEDNAFPLENTWDG